MPYDFSHITYPDNYDSKYHANHYGSYSYHNDCIFSWTPTKFYKLKKCDCKVNKDLYHTNIFADVVRTFINYNSECDDSTDDEISDNMSKVFCNRHPVRTIFSFDEIKVLSKETYQHPNKYYISLFEEFKLSSNLHIDECIISFNDNSNKLNQRLFDDYDTNNEGDYSGVKFHTHCARFIKL